MAQQQYIGITMRSKSNLNAYIERQVKRHVDRDLNTLLEKKLKSMSFENASKRAINRHEGYAYSEFKKEMFHKPLTEVASNFSGFGFSNSQFFDLFSSEIKKSIFR